MSDAETPREIRIYSRDNMYYAQFLLNCDTQSDKAIEALARRRGAGKAKVTGSAILIEDNQRNEVTEATIRIKVCADPPRPDCSAKEGDDGRPWSDAW